MEEAVRGIEGVEAVSVNFLTQKWCWKPRIPALTPCWKRRRSASAELIRTLKWEYSRNDEKQRKTLCRIVIAAALYALAVAAPLEGMLRLAAFLAVYAIIGGDILLKAARNITRGQVFDENFLMSVATVGALCLGEYPEAVAVMLFYQIGELFQSYAVGKSRQSIAALMDIRPDYANVERGGKLEQVDPEEVAEGELIVVKPGERIPLDGVVEEGSSSVDTAALTGESVPREVLPGHEVISGCVNLSGMLKVRVSREFGQSTVARILDLVENSTARKSRSEHFITRFARYYTPAVVFAALALAAIPPLIFGQAFPYGWNAPSPFWSFPAPARWLSPSP